VVERRNAPGLSPPPGYAHVASGGGRLVFTAGAVPLDAEGRLVGEGDYDAQTEQVVANLEAALAAGGATPADVVKTTLYVVPGDVPLSRVWDVFRRSPLSEAPSTLLGVAGLGYTGQLVEIEAVAVVP
jgi:enamine deaminase RidA (YjgF/YER057c/UK114 family)